MKKKMLFLFLVLASISLFAQQDPDAKNILDKLSEKTKSFKNMQIDFKIDYVNLKDDFKNSSNGSIILKNDKYKLVFMGVESYYDGKTLYSYLIESNEVNISEPDPDETDILSNPKQIFTLYEKDYKYQLISQSTEGGLSFAIIDLYPFDLEKDFSRIRLQINTKTYQLKSATIFGKDGSSYSLTVTSFKTNIGLDDNFCVFDTAKHPDAEKIDLRW